jgi:hypothetical protein
MGLQAPEDEEQDKEARKIREAALGRLADAVPGIVGGTVAFDGKNLALRRLRSALGEDQTLLPKTPGRAFPQEGGMVFATWNSINQSFMTMANALAQDDPEAKTKGILRSLEMLVREAMLTAGISDDLLDPPEMIVEELAK